MAASATFALKAGVWFRRGLLLIVSPDSRAILARRQAETPLIALFRFVRPALTTYLRFFFNPPDEVDGVFLATFGNFDQELSLQNIPEVVKPGSVRVPILIYHSMAPHTRTQTPLQRLYDVAPEAFVKQMKYLKDAGYVVISFDALARALEQNITLPPKSVVLTFDDGWRSQYSYAFPVLKKYGYTGTFFIYTDAIDQPHFLTWDQVRLMNNAGMTIGGHTESHPYLPDIHDPALLQKEIIGGKRIIEDQIHQNIYLFAYPFGHYRKEVIDIVKEAGYIAARSTYKGTHNTHDDLYTLKAVEVSDDFNKFLQNLTY